MKKIRMSIPVKTETYDAIERLSHACNASLGSTAGGYLDELAPTFVRVAEAYELFKTNPVKASQLLHSIGDAVSEDLQREQKSLPPIQPKGG